MCRHCEIAWGGEVLSREEYLEFLRFWVVDSNQCCLFETKDPAERSSVEAWRKRQSESVAHGCKFGEKILLDRVLKATLEEKLEQLEQSRP